MEERNYKNLTEEDIRKVMEEMNLQFPRMGKLTPEEIEQKRAIVGNFAIDSFGDEIYQLPGGGITGKGGWNLFIEALKEEANKYGK